MKKYSILAVILVLTATVLAGCRNPSNNMAPTTVPTTHATTTPTTAATTMPATTNSTHATEHTGATENHNSATTVPGDHGMEATNGTAATGEGRARAPRIR